MCVMCSDSNLAIILLRSVELHIKPIRRVSLVFVLRDVTRFTILSPRLVQ